MQSFSSLETYKLVSERVHCKVHYGSEFAHQSRLRRAVQSRHQDGEEKSFLKVLIAVGILFKPINLIENNSVFELSIHNILSLKVAAH